MQIIFNEISLEQKTKELKINYYEAAHNTEKATKAGILIDLWDAIKIIERQSKLLDDFQHDFKRI